MHCFLPVRLLAAIPFPCVFALKCRLGLHVGCNICASAAAAFYASSVSLDIALGHTPALLRLHQDSKNGRIEAHCPFQTTGTSRRVNRNGMFREKIALSSVARLYRRNGTTR